MPPPVKPPVVALKFIELFETNPQAKRTDDELALAMKKAFPASETNFIGMISFYRNKYNRGELPTQKGKPPRFKVGRVVIAPNERGAMERVMLPAHRRGPLLQVARLHVADSAAMRARLEAKKARLVKRVTKEAKVERKARNRKPNKPKRYWTRGEETVRQVNSPGEGWTWRQNTF